MSRYKTSPAPTRPHRECNSAADTPRLIYTGFVYFHAWMWRTACHHQPEKFNMRDMAYQGKRVILT